MSNIVSQSEQKNTFTYEDKYIYKGKHIKLEKYNGRKWKGFSLCREKVKKED